MNGRCDNDPLDPAYDVCDLCGGEFCESCMVERTKRNRQTVCMECSLIQARVRTGKITRVRSRREAKKRRAELQAERSTIQDEGRFTFFDGEDPPPTDEAEAPEPKKRKIKGRSRKGKDQIVEPPVYAVDGSDSDPDEDWLSQLDRLEAPAGVEPDEEFAVPEAPAVEELHKLRTRRESDAPPAALLPTAPEPEPEPEPAAPLGPETIPDTASFDETDPFALASDAPEPQPEPVRATLAPRVEPAALAPEPLAPKPVPAALAPRSEPTAPESLTAAVPEVPASLSGPDVPAALAGPAASSPNSAEERSHSAAATAPLDNDEEDWIPPPFAAKRTAPLGGFAPKTTD